MPWADYQKIREIGAGSFGCAYLVQREKMLLVMKEIDTSELDSKGRQGAEVEVKVLSSLKHPYIVKYHESFVHEGKFLCIVMDYCEGGDLCQYVAQCRRQHSKIPEAQVVRWFTQMCLALKYMHGKKHTMKHAVLHRDIKTQNIFLARKEGGPMGSVKIADFGISKVLTNDGFARTMVGTPYYLSPEVCQKQPYACPADMWALGCVVYELCALRVPFEAQNLQQLVNVIVRGPPPRVPSAYSRDVDAVIGEMLSRDPLKRPSAEALLQRDFIQREIKQMLAEQKASKAHQENHRERSPSHRDAGHCHGERAPLQEHNQRCPSPSGAARAARAAPAKPGSRAPSPHKDAAREVLRPSRAPSPSHRRPPSPAVLHQPGRRPSPVGERHSERPPERHGRHSASPVRHLGRA